MFKNELYPIFLKSNQLNVLIVGGGKVAHEKLSFLLKSSPNSDVLVVAPSFCKEVKAISKKYSVELVQSSYHKIFLDGMYIVLVATNNHQVNEQVYNDCKQRCILVNVADTSSLCDFYLGGIVTKGNVKIAISTNGKSPTLAKRLRQFIEEIIPEEVSDLAHSLNEYRNTLKGSFSEKVIKLNKLTKELTTHQKVKNKGHL